MLFRRIFYLPKFLHQSIPLEFLILSRFNTTTKPSSKMTDWKSEKEKFLNMDIESKRKLYKNEKYLTAEEIPTWREYYKTNEERLVQLLEESNAKDKFHTLPPAFPEGCDQIALWKGDITSLEIDAIVNAANTSLMGGGGVDGAIHRAAGAKLKEECATLGGCKTGEAKITGGYLLPAKYIIHTVGPRGEQPELLESCYSRSLELFEKNKLRFIAFPCVSTGVYGYPPEKAAHVVLRTVRRHLQNSEEGIRKIIFTCFLDEDIKIYETLLQLYFPLK